MQLAFRFKIMTVSLMINKFDYNYRVNYSIVLRFNFSIPTVTLKENVMTAKLTVSKIGINEPDVTFNLSVVPSEQIIRGLHW